MKMWEEVVGAGDLVLKNLNIQSLQCVPGESGLYFYMLEVSVFRVRQIVNFIKTREIESKIQRKESLFNV